MQMFGRTLAILAAALVVIGITMAVSRAGLIAGGNPGFPPRNEVVQRPGSESDADGAVAPGGREVPREGRRPGEHGRSPGGAGLFGLVEVLKSLVVVGLIVAAMAQGPRLERWLRRSGSVPPRQPPVDPAESV